MYRKLIVVGDPPICGGRVLPYRAPYGYTIMDHQVALIGGRVYCEGCHGIGVIAKTGGPNRKIYITEVALEGDVCVCQCPHPQPLVATLQHVTLHDDDDGGGGMFVPETLVPSAPQLIDPSDVQRTNQKLVDEQVEYPPDAQIHENICPNMTNKAFAMLVMELRDEAVVLIGQRLLELDRWDKVAHDRIFEWFVNPGLLRLPRI